MKHKHINRSGEQGLVSIIVVMVLMGILVLVATSFSLLIRREQRQALDRQLSTQAFYAAESGVHDTVAKLSGITSDVTDCATLKNGDEKLDAANKVEYSCVLVDKSPDELVYDSVGIDSSTVVRLQSDDGLPITRIDVSWRDDKEGGVGNQFVPNNGHFLPQKDVVSPETDALTSSQGTGVLRTTIMPVLNTAAMSHSSLAANAKTYFFYPRSGAVNGFGQVNAVTDNAFFVDGNCNASSTPYFCNGRIVNVGATNGGVVYLRLKAIYKPVAVTIRIYTSTGRSDIVNAQAVIDSTGKAQDVLRRIQVRVPLKGSYIYPEFAVDSLDTVCKRMSFAQPGSGVDVSLPTQDTTPNGVGTVYYDRSKDAEVCDPTRP